MNAIAIAVQAFSKRLCNVALRFRIWLPLRTLAMATIAVVSPIISALTVVAGGDAVARSGQDIVCSGTCPEALSAADAILQDFMDEYQVPGGAVAITRFGKLVLHRGYGWADIEAQQPVQPTSLFRIASLSKPITAVAILKLVEKGALYLDDRVADLLNWHIPFAAGKIRDERLMRITVRQLLEHRGGWNRERSFDPMFRSRDFAERLGVPSPPNANQIIEVMLGEPLDHDPGSAYSYSNFGYCLLGRIIEQRSGSDYELFVREQVLAPMGIRRMTLGRSRWEHRLPDEVRYYDSHRSPSVFADDLGAEVPNAYGGWCLETMDAHGGWLSSVDELARFASVVQNPSAIGGLPPALAKAMFERPSLGSQPQGVPAEPDSNPVYYSLGWQNRMIDEEKVNHWHSGSLPGTTAILICRHDGINMIAVLNSRESPTTRELGLALDKVLHRAVNSVTQWPDVDLFASGLK